MEKQWEKQMIDRSWGIAPFGGSDEIGGAGDVIDGGSI